MDSWASIEISKCMESELRARLKEFASCSHSQCQEIMKLVIQKLQALDHSIVSEEQLVSHLQFLKTALEDSAFQKYSDMSFMEVCRQAVLSTVTAVILKNVDESSCHAQKSLSILHKCFKVSLLLVKAVISNAAQLTEHHPAPHRSALYQYGIDLLQLLRTQSVANLDVRCSAGLIFCYIADEDIVSLLREEDVAAFTDKGRAEFYHELRRFVKEDHVNRIALCFGALGTPQNFTSSFLQLVVKELLQHAHNNSTREAVNLGSARVLEIWMEKVKCRLTQLEDLSALKPSLLDVEIFVFTHIAGHIDAVKTCCRNVLANLSVAYSYLSENGNMLKDLCVKLLSKPYHVKWVGLAALVRSNPKSISLLEVLPNAPQELLCAERTFKNAASEVYLLLMTYCFDVFDKEKWVQIWVLPLFETQPSQNSEPNWSQKKYILTKSLTTHAVELRRTLLGTIVTFLQKKNSVNPASPQELLSAPESYLLVVEACKIGAEFNIDTTEMEGSSSLQTRQGQKSFRRILPAEIFRSWTCHYNPQIRLAAFSLLVETKKTSDILEDEDMEAMKLLFKYNIVNQNPAFRQQFLSYFKKLMRRIKDGRSLSRRLKNEEDVSRYDNFVGWMWDFFIRQGLFPGANFSRRCQSLCCLTEMIQHFSVSSYFGGTPDSQLLGHLRWFEDTYEDNKIKAANVLSHMPLPCLKDPTFVTALTERAMEYLTSVRPPDSVTGRYLLLYLLKSTNCYPWNFLRMLLTKLEAIVRSIKKTSLLEVASNSPPYGILRAIRLILAEYKDQLAYDMVKKSRNPSKPLKSGTHPISFDLMQEFVKKLMNACFDLNEMVFPVLGSAAPEGFLPDLNDNPDPNIEPEKSKIVRSINAQMLLVASWRSMKEVCLLLTDLVTFFTVEGELPEPEHKKPQDGPKECVLSLKEVETIGDHLVYLLMNLMHRGVFEQVFVGFKCLAHRLKRAKTRALNVMSQQWLSKVMEQVGNKCTTRRSAGLPFIFLAVLTPEADNEELIHAWMTKLLHVRPEDEDTAVRIHKMNILRSLFRDANFARAIMQWVPQGIKLSICALRCNEWAEQNSGLMLYGSVIRRTFGPKLNLMSAPTFFRKFPEMYDFLLNEVKEVAAKAAQNAFTSIRDCDFAYHLLLLFSCFATAPGTLEEGHFKLASFVPHIRACGSCGDMQVRTIAAKALIPFVASPKDRENLALAITDNLEGYSKRGSSNGVHGSLLQLLTLLRFKKANEEEISDSLKQSLQIVIDIVKLFSCPQVHEAFADLSSIIGTMQDQSLISTALTMQKLTERRSQSLYSSEKLSRRNDIPGLPYADQSIYRSKVTLEFGEDVFDLWLKNRTHPAVSELVTRLADSKELSVSVSVRTNIICSYLSLEERYLGQTDYENNYLSYFASPQFEITSVVESLETDTCSRFVGRLMKVCTSTFGTIDCKAASLQCLGKLIFAIEACSPYRPQFINLIFEWMDTKTEDELRRGVACSLPSLTSDHSILTGVEFSKLWSVALTLGQDDEAMIRKEVFQRLTTSSCEQDIPGCDLKCLEIMVEAFTNRIQTQHTLEGFLTLVGLLVRDDYDFIATVADDVSSILACTQRLKLVSCLYGSRRVYYITDVSELEQVLLLFQDDEDRLFDRSEMNMYAETITFLDIVSDCLDKSSEFLQRLKLLIADDPVVPEEMQSFIQALTNINSTPTQDLKLKQFLNDLLGSNMVKSSSDIEKSPADTGDTEIAAETVQTNEIYHVVQTLFKGDTKALVLGTIKTRLRNLFLAS